ncbi:hypothetical protein BC938DRAFT_472719, partial [Jimgerdemannia flammicorona]
MPTSASSLPPRASPKHKPGHAGTYPPFPIMTRNSPTSSSTPTKTPAYYAERLKECGGKEAGFREMEGGLLADLRVLLRNGVASWTTEFLEAGGYNALFFMLLQIQSLQKRVRGYSGCWNFEETGRRKDSAVSSAVYQGVDVAS